MLRKRHGYNFSINLINESESNMTTSVPKSTTLAPGDVSQYTLDVLWSVTVSIFAIGGMIGGITTAYFTDKFGRCV